MPRRSKKLAAAQLRALLYRDGVLLRLGGISLLAHTEGHTEAADVLNLACDHLGRALDLLGAKRRRKADPTAPSSGS